MTPTVLFSIPWDLHWPGGVNQVLRSLLEHSARTASLRPILFIPDYDTAKETVSTIGGYETVRARVVSVWNEARPIRHLATLLVRWPVSMVRLCRMLHRVKPAAVNVHFPGLWTLTLLWALRWSCPRARFVISFHGSDLKQIEQGGRIARLCWRILLRSADAITCCSASLRNRLVAVAGPDSRTAVVIHNGVDSRLLLNGANGQPLPPALARGPYILNVGTFEQKKGQDVLVRAFASMRHRHPDLRLAIVGRKGPALEGLRRLIEELGIVERATLVADAPHQDTLAIFRGATMFVLSSLDEPFGIVLLEAACLGIPVVATQVGGVPEVVEHEISGILVPSDDVGALASAMERVLDDGRLAADLAARARERAESQFTLDATFERYRSVLLSRDEAAVGHE